MEAVTATEKPLNTGAKAALMAGAAATILLFYISSLLAILLMLVVILILLCLLIVALRFGAAGYVMPIVHRHAELLKYILKSFWLSDSGVEFRLPLTEADAPELFHLVREQAGKLEINPPDVVQLEMGLNAWVQLKGLRQGKGKTILGVGYDLLAGLSKAEMEGVLAHEMTHAKLVQRGLKGWLNSGLHRLITMTSHASGITEAHRRINEHFLLASIYAKVGDWLTKLAARQIRAYSRQDEFEADHGAAELCGAAKIRSSLEKLESLGEITEQLPWKERVARLQLEGGYSNWLRHELAKAETSPLTGRKEVLNQYSTHPLLKDRIAALPDDGSALPSNPQPAINLLAGPDEVADKLVVEIQKQQAVVEEKDSKELRKWTKKTQGGAGLQPLQGLAVLFFILAGILSFYMLVDAVHPAPLILGVSGLIGGGIFLFKVGRYKDRTPLPVPEYSAFIQNWRKLSDLKDIEAEQKKLETEFSYMTRSEKKKKKRAQLLAASAYAALGRGEYLRAHVAARLCLREHAETVEGVVGLSIASAAMNMPDQVGRSLHRLKQMTGLKSPETIWAAAWALILAGDWSHAEAFLDQALAKRPLEASWRMLLALTQARRGKLQNAIKNAREACELKPGDEEGAKLFINLLLEGGYFREAQERLTLLGDKLQEDPELMMAQVRVHLIQQRLEEANVWAEQLKEKAPNGRMIVRLGEAYEEARRYNPAMACYYLALEKGHYPEAYVGLGRLEAQQKNPTAAKNSFLAALALEGERGEKAAGPWDVFNEVIGRLLMMEDQVLNCRAWVAKLTGAATPKELAHQTFLVFAPEQDAAERYFNTILEALRKGMPPLLPGALIWQDGSKQQQPDGPAHPGVQGVLN